MSKWDNLATVYQPKIAFSTEYEIREWYKRIFKESTSSKLYFEDGVPAMVGEVAVWNGRKRLISVRRATFNEIRRVRPFKHNFSNGEVFYTGVGGVSREGISYTGLKSNPYVAIDVEDYFKGNVYLYSLSEGVKGKVTKAPLVLISSGGNELSIQDKYDAFQTYVLPSSLAYEDLFGAIFLEAKYQLGGDGEVVRLCQFMAYLLTPFDLVRMVLDVAVRLEANYEYGFLSYLNNHSETELMVKSVIICQTAQSKLEEIFEVVFGLSSSEVGSFNRFYLECQLKFLSRMLSNIKFESIS